MRNLRVLTVIFFCILFSEPLLSQVVESDKAFPGQEDEITITFYADRGDRGLMGFTGDVYAHTGVITTASSSSADWKYVKTDWGENTAETKLTRTDTDIYQLVISPDVMTWYGIPEGETVLRLAFVFRNSDGSLTGRDTGGGDIFLELYMDDFTVKITNPQQSETIVGLDEVINVEAIASEESELRLYIDDNHVATSMADEITYDHTASVKGQVWIWVSADNGTSVVYDSVYYYAMGDVPQADLPAGVVPGVNYTGSEGAIVVLHDPPALKEFVFLRGDFNEWSLQEEYLMNRTPDGEYHWLSITGLVSGREYAYQFFMDGNLKIADPYTHKVLDPWNDQYISSVTYPGLKEYPVGMTSGIVSILQTDQPAYNWEVSDFTPPDVKDLVIYELLVRDFVSDSDIKSVTDSLDYLVRLGVNAVELMPVNEFEGNDSWGYNPSFYFATDKAYGTRNDYKRFIDECHKRGIAVILDMVLNHSYGQSPMVQMYFDEQAGSYGQPSAENPWYNQVCPHPPYCWGYDFDHESIYTRNFIDSVNHYWIDEFRVDGFRFDFTKGFTNSQTPDEGSAYDASRIANLERMGDNIWAANERAHIILEHFAENSEEKVLAQHGMLLWRNMNYQYNEGTMGYSSNLSGTSYLSSGWSDPHLVAYMESHDEERLMYKNIRYGNSGDGYDIQQPGTALERMELAAAFYFTIPGPKMIWQFGEVGYDYSINHCPDGTVSVDCRTARKPVRWDYYDNWQRKRLFDVYAMLTDLKKSQPVFSTADFSTSLTGVMKKIHLNHTDNKITVLGNFGVTGGTIIPDFQETGTWYEFFSRESIEVTDVTAGINMQPGEYRLYSLTELPDHGISLSSQKIEPIIEADISVYPNPSTGMIYIDFNLQEKQYVTVNMYNLQGQKIATLVNQTMYPDSYEILINLSSVQGDPVATGVYLIEVIKGDEKTHRKIVIQ